jgi:hypothetical protein
MHTDGTLDVAMADAASVNATVSEGAGMLPVEGSGQSRAGVLSRLDLVLDNPLASFETADTAVNRCSRIFRVCIACFIGRRTSGLSKHCCCRDFG